MLAGDYNVVPTDADIYPTKSYAKNALVQPEPRALFRRLLDQGWIDAIRTMHPDAPMYTFWDYKRNRWQRDAGLRIDHLLLNPKAAKRLVDAGVDREVRGLEGASDHAPAWIVLSDKPTVRRKSVRQSKSHRDGEGEAVLRRSAPVPRRPLLVIDGNSFAHRSYHALPKTILGRGRKPAGAILGFANMLLRLYREEQPRAVLVAWDTLEVPTYRHERFPAYQSGREFDDALLEQLEVLPEFVAACGFQNAKAPGFEADDFLAAAAAKEEKRGGTVLVASGDRDTFQLASDRTTIFIPSAPARWRVSVPPKFASATASSLAGSGFHCLARRSLRQGARRTGVGATGAATLLQRYGSLEAALCGAVPAMPKACDFSVDRHHGPKGAAAEPSQSEADLEKAAALAQEWELNQLARRLEERAVG